jgi:hypothetical protein
MGKISDQSWDSYDLVAPGQLGILQQIDQLDAVFIRQMLSADFLKIREGRDRFRRLACHIEP